MQTIKTYLYDQIAEVQFLDSAVFTTRNRQVYSRPIKVYQGIDNPVQVIVKNQDQKTVNLTGYNIVASVQDPTNQITIADYIVTWANVQLGQGTFTLDNATISSLEQRFYKLTFKRTLISAGTQTPLYIDDNYGVPLDLEVLPAYYSNIAVLTDTYTMDGGTI